jgi:FG-GAP-like repeat/Putative Ig domain
MSYVDSCRDEDSKSVRLLTSDEHRQGIRPMSRACVCTVALFLVAIAAAGCSSSGPPISVSLSPSSPQAIDQTQTLAITATVVNDTSNAGVTWSLNGPGSLSNTTVSSATYNTPTTSLTSSEQVTITATSIAQTTKSASLQITLNLYPQIPFQTFSSGLVGTPYSQAIALTGGTSPFQWSVYDGPIVTGYAVAGAVPDGLMLNPSNGTITGTPTAAGTWYFEATVTDATGASAFNGFCSIQINPNGPAGNPVPFLNQTLVPTAVAPGSAGFTLSVSGTEFVSGATIDFNGAPLTTTFVDSEHLTATVPATDVASAETASVKVVNPGPAGGASNVVYFQVGASEATVSFATAVNSPIAMSEPSAVVAADFNEDGKPDLIVTGNIRVYVLLGNGDGTFTPSATSPISVASPPYDDFASPYTGPLAVADFNHSGHLGLAVGEFDNEAAAILFGNGKGTFTPSSAGVANAEGMVYAIASADFNADGNLDLAFANQAGGSAPVLLGYGDGAFTPVSDLLAVGFPIGIALGDFNGDGKLDAVVANGGSSTYPDSGLTVSLGNGDGTFTSGPNSPISLGSNLSGIVAADFNGDGKLDIAVTDAGTNTVMILLGNGDGTFGAPLTIPVGNEPYAIAEGDFNNDGKIDLAIINLADSTLTLLLGNGDGTFTQASGSPYAVGSGPEAITVADFNGDGKLDLAIVNFDASISVLLQQ